MYRLLKIKKESSNNFWHYDSMLSKPYFVSQFTVDVDNDFFQVVRLSGARGYEYRWSDVTFQDGSGSVETFGSREDLIARLVDVKYPAFFNQNNNTAELVLGKKGESILLNETKAYFLANFDLSDPNSATYGIGINERAGWAIKNGLNGTENLGEKTVIGWNPADESKYPFGATGGLEDWELLKHRHGSVEFSDGKFAENQLGDGNTLPYNNRHLSVSSSSGGKKNLTEEIGSVADGSMKNLPPYKVCVWIERIVDESILVSSDSLSPIPTPSLAQVLNVSDRPVILHDVANGDFTFDTTHIGKYICFTGGGIIDAVIPDNTYDPAIWVNLVGSVGYGTFINLKCNGGTMSRIIGHEFRIIPFEVKLAEPLTNGWVVNAEPISHFEVQLTQHGTNAPEILTSSVIGAMNASISTTYNSDGDYYIVADLPIFANVKDYIKNSVYKKTDFITVYPGLSTFGVTVIYVDDYTLRVNTYDYTDSFYVYLLNDVMQEPTLIQIPFKP